MILDKKNFIRRKNDVKKEIEYKNWKIWWWDENDTKHIKYIKQPDLDGVIQFCKFTNLKKYSVFNEEFKNVCNDGSRVAMG